MASNFHFRLSEDLSIILDDADDYNVIIQVGENQNIKEFRAHSVILRARSPYFKSALSTNWIKKKDNMIIFNKPNITPTVFHMILKYIYTGELDLTKQSGENILGLIVASDELLLEELFRHDCLSNSKEITANTTKQIRLMELCKENDSDSSNNSSDSESNYDQELEDNQELGDNQELENNYNGFFNDK